MPFKRVKDKRCRRRRRRRGNADQDAHAAASSRSLSSNDQKNLHSELEPVEDSKQANNTVLLVLTV